MGVKNAHMVSKGYIRAWADGKKRVEVIDKQNNLSYTRSFNGATVVNYVYDPKILNHDLEQEYAGIESAGIPVINKLRKGDKTLTIGERSALIAFMDMHLDRGRYANQAETLATALVLKTDGTHENSDLNLGDLLCLSQGLREVLRLRSLDIEEWPWRVERVEGLATGDGAVLLWGGADSERLTTVTFPLSPTQLLVIGENLAHEVPINELIAQNSKRWIIGEVGTLNLDFAKTVKVQN